MPFARYQRVLERKQAVFLFAGKTIRFIHVALELRVDQQPKIIFAEFGQCSFDETGYLDQGQVRSQLLGATRTLDVFGQSDWENLYRLEYIEPYK